RAAGAAVSEAGGTDLAGAAADIAAGEGRGGTATPSSWGDEGADAAGVSRGTRSADPSASVGAVAGGLALGGCLDPGLAGLCGAAARRGPVVNHQHVPASGRIGAGASDESAQAGIAVAWAVRGAAGGVFAREGCHRISRAPVCGRGDRSLASTTVS